MRDLYAILFFILCTVIMIYYLSKEKDIFSPMVMFPFLALAHYLPGIAYIEEHLFITIDDNAALIVFLHESFAILCTVIGYFFYQHTIHKKKYYVDYGKNISLKWIVFAFYSIGFLFGILYLRSAGGWNLIIKGTRGVDAGNGRSYIRAMMFLMVIAMCLYMHYRKERHLMIINPILVCMYLGYCMFYIILTSRSPVLEALMILIMIYHYDNKRLRFRDIFRPRNITLAVIGAIFIVVIPVFRAETGFSDFSFVNTVQSGLKSITNIFVELSYTSRDSFVYKNYNLSNYWYGSNIINLLSAPLPSTIFKWKPPVDDGMYLANAVMGHFIKPPSKNLPWNNSFPLSTPAGLYINFGFVGLMFGSILLGWLYGKAYSILRDTDYDINVIIIYQLIIYQLEFSSLSIQQTLTPLVTLVVFMKLFSGWKLRYDVKRRI